MKAFIIFTLMIITPIFCDQEHEGIDYYDADDYFDAPILRPSEFTIEELVNPNFSINPDSSLTFNYEKVIDGQSPQPIEKRKESIQHYFRVRKPPVKQVIYHIKRNKFTEGKEPTPFNDQANVEKEINNTEFDHASPANLNEEEKQSVPQEQQEETNDDIKVDSHRSTDVSAFSKSLNFDDPQIPESFKNDILQPVTISEKQEAVTDISTTTLENFNLESHSQTPRLRMRSRQKLRKNEQTRNTENLVQTTVPTILRKNKISITPSTIMETNVVTDSLLKSYRGINISSQKRAKGRKWLHSTATPTISSPDVSSTTPYKNNKIPVMRFRQKWQASGTMSTQTPPMTTLITSQESTEEDNTDNTQKIGTDESENSKIILNNESSTPNQNLIATTYPPSSYYNSKKNAQPKIKPRILRRKFQKSTISPLSSDVPDRNGILSSTAELSTTHNLYSEDNTISQKTDDPTTVTTEQYSRKRKNLGRKWLRPRPTTNKPEEINVTPSVIAETSTQHEQVENQSINPRRRHRKRFRKTRLTTTPATEIIIVSSLPSTQTSDWLSLQPDSTERKVSEEDSKDTSENSEILVEENPKSRFSEDNPPPPVPTLSPWYDGYGK